MEHILLDPEQTATLRLLLDVTRRVPATEREPIRLVGFDQTKNLFVVHPGVPADNPPEVYPGDVDTLADAGLLRVTRHGAHGRTVEVTPLGRAYVDRHLTGLVAPTQRGTDAAREYVAGDEFERAYRPAFAKWAEADRLLWQDDVAAHLSTIGHLCREAMQLFADGLVQRLRVQIATDVTKTVARMKAVLAQLNTGEAHSAFLDAQLAYWGTVNDLVQRQEHGAAKEGEPLRHEDARRVVLHTLLVMYEWHRTVLAAPLRRAAA